MMTPEQNKKMIEGLKEALEPRKRPEALIEYVADMKDNEKLLEKGARHVARRLNWSVCKSRRALSVDNYGGLMLADDRNAVVCGARFDATPEEIIEWCNAELRRLGRTEYRYNGRAALSTGETA